MLGQRHSQISFSSAFLVQTYFMSKKILGPKMFWVSKILGQTNFGFKKIMGSKELWVKKVFGKRKFWVKKIQAPKDFGSKNHLSQKKTTYPDKGRPQNIYTCSPSDILWKRWTKSSNSLKDLEESPGN